ncbi:MAG: hypothetical protein J6Q65_04700, partial [Lentisphaeria bacterium]|nr:hypothetical protein [Lentisphaeria bacterium]
FAWGRNRVLATDPAKLMKPGRRIFIAGAVIVYGTLFGIAINLPTDHWYALTCGAVSALSSGVFMVMTYWSFRMFQYPNTANDVRKFCGMLLFALIFLHAGAASLFQSLTITLILLAGAVIARLSAIWLSRK